MANLILQANLSAVWSMSRLHLPERQVTSCRFFSSQRK